MSSNARLTFLFVAQVQNFYGAVGLRHDLISLATMTLTPYRGNMLNSTLNVDGVAAVLERSRWSVCEGTRAGMAGTVSIANAVRLVFESYSVLQQWTLLPADAGSHTVDAMFDGPFFRRCDSPGQSSCGWGTNFPIDRLSFTSRLTTLGAWPAVMLTTDSKTGVASAAAIWFESGTSNLTITTTANNTFRVHGDFADSVVLRQAFSVGDNESAALALLATIIDDNLFATAFTAACEQWEQRWQAAFKRPASDGGSGTHFSGNLPTLNSNAPEIDRLYYWSALAMVSLERTNLLSGPRQFVISEGPSNSLDGSAGMGGSGQVR